MSNAGQEFSKGFILGRDQNTVSVDFGHDGISNEEWRQAIHKEGDMSANISKTELEALLKANKAEVDAVASGMREEMAKWRETQNAQMVQMNATLTSIAAKMDAKFDVIDAKIDSVDKSLNGRIEGMNTAITGINTAISGIQSGISTKLTIFGVIMAVLLAIAGWWFSSNQSPTSQQAQPTVIYVQQPVQQQNLEPPKP